MKTYRIAAIPGDGIGGPVTDAALAVAVGERGAAGGHALRLVLRDLPRHRRA